jgi:hypothetical protein
VSRWLQDVAEYLPAEEQNGFRKGCSCTDNIFMFKQVIEKGREYSLETHTDFNTF